MNKSVERTGVIRDDKTGELFIPATQRPDGTWRKPKKVKEGYIPEEEMPKYECKGVQWLKSKPTLPVGLAPEPTKPTQDKPSKSALRRAKKREKKEKMDKENDEEEAEENQVETLTEVLVQTTLTNGEQELCAVERQKKLRSLRKKLKQIEELEEQLKVNKSLKVEKEQLEKLQRKAQIIAEISQLENDQ